MSDAPGGATTSLRRTALYDRHVALGAKLADFGGWEMPIEYPGGGVLREHEAVRTKVGVFDVSHLGKLSVTGPGAAAFVNSCLTNDLGRIGPGRAQYTMCCDDATGGVVDDLFVVPARRRRRPPRPQRRELRRGRRAAAGGGAGRHRRRRPARGLRRHRRPGHPLRRDARGHRPAGRPRVPHVRRRRVAGAAGHRLRTGYTGERGYEILPAWEITPALWDAAARRPPPTGAACRAASAPGTRCAPRWATHSTATS